MMSYIDSENERVEREKSLSDKFYKRSKSPGQVNNINSNLYYRAALNPVSNEYNHNKGGDDVKKAEK